MKFNFVSAMALLVGLLISIGSSAVTIKCASESRGLKSHLHFSSTKPVLEVGGSFNGLALQPYVFFSEYMVCGLPVSETTSCSVTEGQDPLKPGSYDFQFTCTDGRKGQLHSEGPVVMATCFKADGALANQQGSESCAVF